MPKRFAFRGDRLAYTAGILVLGGVATVLVVAFHADTHLLIPLYAVGVFIDFTISQSGMVKHWLSERPTGWYWRLSINAAGAVTTGIVAIVVTGAKAPDSLWVLVLMVGLVSLMTFIGNQYANTRRQLEVREGVSFGPPHRHEHVVIPVPGLSRAVVQAVQFGRSLSDDVTMVHITDDIEEAERLRQRMEQTLPGVPFVIVESPYRSLVRPFITYLDVMSRDRHAITLVVIPEYVARHWWERILYNQTSSALRAGLLGRPDTVVANVPYRRDAAAEPVGASTGSIERLEGPGS
jgi:hypothetical protein